MILCLERLVCRSLLVVFESPGLHSNPELQLQSALPRSPRASLKSGNPKRPTPSALWGSNPLGSPALEDDPRIGSVFLPLPASFLDPDRSSTSGPISGGSGRSHRHKGAGLGRLWKWTEHLGRGNHPTLGKTGRSSWCQDHRTWPVMPIKTYL